MSATINTGGDDLDNFDFQLAPSGDEGSDHEDASMSPLASDAEDQDLDGEGGDAAAFLSDDEETSPAQSSATGIKRKADEEPGTSQAKDEKADKKKKRKLQEKLRKEKRKIREQEALQPFEMDVQELDDFLFESLKQTYSKASDIELKDLRIPVNVLQSTSAFTEPRTLESLPNFVKSHIPPLPKRLKKAGTPSMIVLSPSGIRAADIVRALKNVRSEGTSEKGEDLKPPGEVGKLFAKHFKVAEQIEYLEKTKIWAGVGTPGRIGKILSEGDALTIRQQTVILLDLSYRDSKNRTLLTIPEIRDEFWKVLFGDQTVRAKLLATGVKIAVF